MKCDDKLPFCEDLIKKCPSPWDLTQDSDCFIDNVVKESLDIAGAPINVYKLLGVHEQGKLIDLTGQGISISGGDNSIYPSKNVFFDNNKEWRSIQKGQNVISNAYIGYDFGPVKMDNLRLRYGIETEIRKHITTIVIKQGLNSKNRATKIRVERSDNNKDWYGVAIINLPDNNTYNEISFKQSSPARYWRLRPILFNGTSTDYWSVISLKLMDYNKTNEGNIQDLIFLENRTRDYIDEPIKMKGYYDHLDVQSEISKFGSEFPSQIYFMNIHFGTCVQLLGRPIIIGDIIEMPTEVQYDRDLNPIKKYSEVTDVSWSVEGYTPNTWRPTLLRLVLQPAMASEETQDIFGDLSFKSDNSGLLNIDDSKYQSLIDVDSFIKSEADSQVHESGEDISEIAEIPNDEVTQQQIDNYTNIGVDLKTKFNVPTKGLYVEDAMPPNGKEYSQGDTFPSNPKNGDYHRLSYTGLAKDIPIRLFRWSLAKNRWIYLETDRRFEFDDIKPTIQKLLKDKDSVPTSKIEK